MCHSSYCLLYIICHKGDRDVEKMDITHLQITFTSYQGFKTGIWVSPEDVMLVK
jgi:hypothetical protein